MSKPCIRCLGAGIDSQAPTPDGLDYDTDDCDFSNAQGVQK